MRRLIRILLLVLGLSQWFGCRSNAQPFSLLDPNVPPEIRYSSDCIPSGFPISTANLVLWADIRCGVTNTAGASPPSDCSSFLSWRDLSGNGDALLDNGHSVPTDGVYVGTSGCDSKGNYPYIYNQNSSAYTNKLTWTISQPYTLVFVWYIQPDTAAASFDVYDPKGTGNNFGQLNHAFGSSWAYHWYAGTDLTLPSGTLHGNAWKVVTFQFNGSSSFIRENGTQVFTGNPGSGAMTGISIGDYNTGGGAAAIGCKAVIVLHEATSNANLLTLEEWLGAGLGVGGIP